MFFAPGGLLAQDLAVVLGQNRLPITEYFTIAVKVRRQPFKTIGDFPRIDGFQQSRRTRSEARITAGSTVFTEVTITQHYAALKEGTFVLKPFGMVVNGQTVRSPGTTIKVEPVPAETGGAPKIAPGLMTAPGPAPVLIKSNSYLHLETEKTRVYVGEGVRVRLYFYLHHQEQGLLDFYRFADQYPALLKQLQNTGVWEQSYEVNMARPDTVTIRDQKFIRFKLSESVLYPLTNQSLKFPALTLQMAQRATPQAYAEIEVPPLIQSFTSKPMQVAVRELPPHPRRETVAVGVYQLREGIDRTTFKTNQSFTYSVVIAGRGNLSALALPENLQVPGVEVFPPVVQLDPEKAGLGRKVFKYTLLPRVPGTLDFKDFFSIILFNPETERYDTLRSELKVRVAGQEEQISRARPEEIDPFYRLIAKETNSLTNLNKSEEIKLYTNLVILCLICATLYVFFKK